MSGVDLGADPRRLRFLIELAESSLNTDADAAADLAGQAAELARQLDAPVELGRAMYVLAQLHDRAGQPALETLGEIITAVELLREGPPTTLGWALCLLGRLQLDLSDFTSAVANLREAEAIGVAANDASLVVDASFNIAVSVVSASPRNLERCEPLLLAARDKARAAGDRLTETFATYDLGVILRYSGQMERAREAFNETLRLAEAGDYRSLAIDAWSNLAMTAAAEGDAEEAKAAARRAAEFAVGAFAENQRAGIQLAFGCAQLADGDPLGARATIEAAMAERPGSAAWHAECAPWIVDCYVAMGDYPGALQAHQRLHELWEKVRDEQDVSRLRALEVSHRVDQVQREAEAERRERERLELASRRREHELASELAMQVARLRVAEERLADDPLATLPGPDEFAHAVASRLTDGKGVVLGVLTVNRSVMPETVIGETAMEELVARLQALAITEPDLVIGRRSLDLVLALPGSPTDTEPRLRAIVDRLREPLKVGDEEVVFAITGGMASGPAHGTEVNRLLDRAELAGRSVRTHRRETVRSFDPILEHNQGERRFVERALREAMQHGGLELHYQPEVECATGRLVGAEALLRWTHPERGPIPPSVFVPIAEETDLILDLGAWVLTAMCRQAAAWRNHADFVLSANVSAAQVVDGAVVAGVREAISQEGLSPDRVAIELTETLLVEDDLVPQGLADVRDLGVAVLLDDFGTGYSSLSYLAKLPLDAVKVDRSFITDVDRYPSRAAITQAMVTMVHSLGLNVIAEGVERAEELAVLTQQGYDVYQGWLYSKALPAADVEALLTAR